MEICYNNSQWDPIPVSARKIKCSWMHLLEMLLRCINAVGCVKKRHAPRCIHKMQAILSVSLQNLAVLTAALAEPLSVSLWNDLADPVFDGVGQAGSKSRANAFFLVFAARSSFVFYCYSIFLLSFYGLVGIAGQGSSDCSGVNRSLPALHCRPLLIIKTPIIILIIKWPQ